MIGNRLSAVSDLTCILKEKYDLAVFAAGFETRCTYVPNQLDKANLAEVKVFGFKEDQTHKDRIKADKFYHDKYSIDPQIVSGNDYESIYKILNSLDFASPPRLLIDYSSMTRHWYAAVLNWCRFQETYSEIVIDFAYSVGKYGDEPEPMVIETISTVPGFSGAPTGSAKSILVFGVGFEGRALSCVFDRLEPDVVYVIIANPAASELAYIRSKQESDELIKIAKSTMELPIGSVTTAYQGFSGLVRSHEEEDTVTLVPMGPKPHVLAALLTGIRFPSTTILSVTGRGNKHARVGATEDIILTRVKIGNDL